MLGVRRRTSTGFVAVALAGAAAQLVGSGAQAQRSGLPTIAVDDPDRPQARTEADLTGTLRRQLGSLDGIRVVPSQRARYVLRGAVTHLGSSVRGGKRVLRCEVSLLVAERRTGTIRALLTGRSMTRAGDVESLRPLLVNAAVRAALKPLPGKLAGRAPLALQTTR